MLHTELELIWPTQVQDTNASGNICYEKQIYTSEEKQMLSPYITNDWQATLWQMINIVVDYT
jgi:hypothetical protein